MDEEVVTELQEDFNTKKIKIELQRILEPNHRTQLLQKYEILEKLGGTGASEQTAKLIITSLKQHYSQSK
jgi:lipid-A-disaccharide synthase